MKLSKNGSDYDHHFKKVIQMSKAKSGESPISAERKARLVVKPLSNGRYKIKLHKLDKRYLQQLTDDITDIDASFDPLEIKTIFGAMGWVQVSESVYMALEQLYDIRKVQSRAISAFKHAMRKEG